MQEADQASGQDEERRREGREEDEDGSAGRERRQAGGRPQDEDPHCRRGSEDGAARQGAIGEGGEGGRGVLQPGGEVPEGGDGGVPEGNDHHQPALRERVREEERRDQVLEREVGGAAQ